MVRFGYRTPWIVMCLLLFILFVASAPGFAAEAGEEEITAAIQKQYQNIESFRTEFTQELINASSQSSEERSGRIVYQRPRRIHWETRSPEKEVLILNEDTVWDYYPAEAVAYRYSLGQKFDSQTMLRFISGDVDLRREFNVQRLEPESGDRELIRLKLVPKDPDPSLVEAELHVDAEEMLIKRIKLIDFFGNRNILRFQNIERNCEPDPDLFVLEPPEDTRVVDKAQDNNEEAR